MLSLGGRIYRPNYRRASLVPDNDGPMGCWSWSGRSEFAGSDVPRYVAGCHNARKSTDREIAETAPRYIRGALISTYQLLITLGIFLASCINFGTYEHQRHNATSWRLPIGIGFVWIAILGAGILLFHETPRFDYRQGRIEEAKTTMCKVYGAPPNHYAIYEELGEIQAQLETETAKGGAFSEWYNMFFAPRMAYRIALGMTIQMMQQLTGANYFFYYGTVAFKATGINNSYVTQMILNGINFGTTFYGLYVVEHYGRRKSLMVGSAWMFICFLIFASVGHFSLDRQTPENTPKSGVAMICFASFFIFGFATTWGPMIWTICGELYPSRYRAKAMALRYVLKTLLPVLSLLFTNRLSVRQAIGSGTSCSRSSPPSSQVTLTSAMATSLLDVTSREAFWSTSSSWRAKVGHWKKCLFIA